MHKLQGEWKALGINELIKMESMQIIIAHLWLQTVSNKWLRNLIPKHRHGVSADTFCSSVQFADKIQLWQCCNLINCNVIQPLHNIYIPQTLRIRVKIQNLSIIFQLFTSQDACIMISALTSQDLLAIGWIGVVPVAYLLLYFRLLAIGWIGVSNGLRTKDTCYLF